LSIFYLIIFYKYILSYYFHSI